MCGLGRGPIGTWLSILINLRVGSDEAEPQQPFAKSERTHERAPALAHVGGRMHRIGGGVDGRNRQELGMSHARIMRGPLAWPAISYPQPQWLWMAG